MTQKEPDTTGEIAQAALDEAERILNQTAECLIHVLRAVQCVEQAQKQIDRMRARLEQKARALAR